ncbi:succinate dehydrogenase assembly factor 2 [Sphingomicrobium sediminis]|uniref:FAD assembly factor SdhE n=1 Tax=Sphingomicrobium sediminis TaxID=2950949 RepID=A0A9X2J327_9SPHN|nr:succinate dehydrogenase assembly factor 2 [Sphingomicrobium sediminis]MCM8556871.1 succinate dehydrogenase assembly factor 2 [Sphingomicrobium sediminis]
MERIQMDERQKRDKLGALKYRSHHRGTREADMMIGGFFDRYQAEFTEADMDWFDMLLTEQDVDIMAWAIGTAEAPVRYRGPMLDKLQKLDFIRIAR